jgi:carbamoyl-phosphate synthase large subunit
VASHIVGVDIDPFAAGLYLLDRGCLVPKYSAAACWTHLEQLIADEQIDWVIPSINEGLTGWATRYQSLTKQGVNLLLSPAPTVEIFSDKWRTYEFFAAHSIPTPRTSLRHDFELLKPRVGRGSSGIRREAPTGAALQDEVSQEYLEGREFSVDALCDSDGRVLYIVPRERLHVVSGLSMTSQVFRDEAVERHVHHILEAIAFYGPINIQGFRTPTGVKFTEINPRLAGGLSLSIAATENWFALLSRLQDGATFQPRPVKDRLTMMRQFSDVIVPADQLLS